MKITGGTFIDKVQYMYSDSDCPSRKDFYDPTNIDSIYTADNIVQTESGGIYTTIVKIPRISGKHYSFLIRDVDGRTKYITDGTSTPVVIPATIPSISAYYNASAHKIVVIITNPEDGGTLEYGIGGYTNSPLITNSPSITTIIFEINSAIPNNTYYFKFSRNDGATPVTCICNTNINTNLDIQIFGDETNPRIFVTGLLNYSATISYQAKDGKGNALGVSKQINIPSGRNEFETSDGDIQLDYIPAKYEFKVKDVNNREDSCEKTYMPEINIEMQGNAADRYMYFWMNGKNTDVTNVNATKDGNNAQIYQESESLRTTFNKGYNNINGKIDGYVDYFYFNDNNKYMKVFIIVNNFTIISTILMQHK